MGKSVGQTRLVVKRRKPRWTPTIACVPIYPAKKTETQKMLLLYELNEAETEVKSTQNGVILKAKFPKHRARGCKDPPSVAPSSRSRFYRSGLGLRPVRGRCKRVC